MVYSVLTCDILDSLWLIFWQSSQLQTYMRF